MKKLNIVALIEYGSETGIEYLYELRRRGIKIDSIVCIGSEYSEKEESFLKKDPVGYLKRKAF